MRLVGECDPDLVVMDIRMPGVDGLEALKTLRSRHPDVYVAMMTAYGTSQTSIDAFRSGAFEYLTKPLDLQQLRTVIQQAVAAQREPAADGDANGARDAARAARQPRRRHAGDARDLQDDRTPGDQRRCRADRRRARHREGTGRGDDPRQQRQKRGALRHPRLRRAVRGCHRGRPLRPRRRHPPPGIGARAFEAPAAAAAAAASRRADRTAGSAGDWPSRDRVNRPGSDRGSDRGGVQRPALRDVVGDHAAASAVTRSARRHPRARRSPDSSIQRGVEPRDQRRG